MAFDNRFDEYFPVTYQIIECYDMLTSLLMFDTKEDNESNELIVEMKNLIKHEFSIYNKLSLEGIKKYSEELSKIPQNWHDLEDLRILYRLACVYDRTRGYTVNSKVLFPQLDLDIELGVRDIINSKISIDTYKVISNKLKSLNCSDEMSIEYTDKLIKLNKQRAIFRLGMRELSEILSLEVLFDIDNIANIDLKDVEKKLSIKSGKNIDLKEDVKDKIYFDVVNLLDGINKTIFNPDDVASIYDNLFLVSYLEVLLDYLDIDQLMTLHLYFGQIKVGSKLIKRNINMLIKRKIDNFEL